MLAEIVDRHSERSVRIAKAKEYTDTIGSAYPARSHRSHTIALLLEQFSSLAEQTTPLAITVCGRVRQWREHGKLTFIHVEDATGRIQVALSQEHLTQPHYDQLRLFDVGDIVSVTGTVFTTHKGEHSILGTTISLLSKAIQPLPDEWQGLQDEELRYRRRYVDLLLRPELRDMFIKKSKFWEATRNFLRAENFQEVETPVLETTPGGADAEPFVTHHNALGIDLYLRISMGELWQKRLMVAGFEKTFEIGRQFRNEGISPEHLQDYTQMEFYWAFADYNDTMQLVERMYKHVIMETFGSLRFTIHGFDINFDQAWPKLDYVTAIDERLHINVLQASDADIVKKCQELKLEVAIGTNRGRLIDLLWKQCRKQIAGPVFLINHPVQVSPLAKRKADQPELVERYQVIIAGSELGNGYSELNDPIDQAERFAGQAEMRAAGDSEAQMHDQDFVEALEYGMPPTSGFGVSERLFSFLMDKPIRECVLFPLLRPKPVLQATSQANPAAITDETMQVMTAGISRADAWAWLQQEVKDENLRRHMLATAAFMQRLGEHYGAKSPEAWGIAGLLHDIDWEKTTPEQHSIVGADMLASKGINTLIVNAVREHNDMHKLPVTTQLSKCLQILEQLTGIVVAATFVRPNKDISGLVLASLKKKFKDKGFAKGVNRDTIKRCETELNLPLDQALQLCLEAMQAQAAVLGFN